jgi:hypothetical protein
VLDSKIVKKMLDTIASSCLKGLGNDGEQVCKVSKPYVNGL